MIAIKRTSSPGCRTPTSTRAPTTSQRRPGLLLARVRPSSPEVLASCHRQPRPIMSAAARVRSIPGNDRTPSIPTPVPALVTARGQLPNLPRELLDRSLHPDDPPLLLQIPLVDWFCLNPNQKSLGADLFRSAGGLHSFAALPRCRTLLSTRTASSGDFVTKTPGRALTISTEHYSHRPVISPEQVVSLHEALQTDFFEGPSDAPFLHAPSKRAVPRSVERATALTEEMFLHVSSSEKAYRDEIYLPVQGGVDEKQRALSAQSALARYTANKGMIAGFTLAGFFAGESPEERAKAIGTVLDILPEAPLRVLAGHGGAPVDVLEAVAGGVDIIEASYPFDIAASGYALDLASSTKLNVRDRKWERSGLPLLEGCKCVACAPGKRTGGFYTRAYIRHLLEVHEMMGETLIAAHNLRNYLDWFAELRMAVEKGAFEEFHARFLRSRERERNQEGLPEVEAPVGMKLKT